MKKTYFGDIGVDDGGNIKLILEKMSVNMWDILNSLT
jgi:hypothetical protein